MTLEAAILKNIENLPDSVKQSVFLYTEFLSSQYAKEKSEKTDKTLEKTPLAGSMKGTFVLPLPDNFDEPLEEFEEYM
jgi:Protein of unknown function (DUF2281)